MKVCIVSEGGYPVARGGLAEWIHRLITTLPDVEFSVFCITANPGERSVYERLPNVKEIVMRPLYDPSPYTPVSLPALAAAKLDSVLRANLRGEPLDLAALVTLRRQYRNLGKGWLLSRSYWNVLREHYNANYGQDSFQEYFWTAFGLQTLLFDLTRDITQIPRANVYHALSTGFAGVSAAIAKVIYGRPTVLTEQGLYLKERIVELTRINATPLYRKLFTSVTESILRTSFTNADRIALPCRSHIETEKELGLDPLKVTIINNGIELEKYKPGKPRNGGTPVVGCFARVVPIKGLEVLIQAAKTVRQRYDADFLVVGEIQDRQYHDYCQKLALEAGLGEHFKFTGHQEPMDWYPRIDVFTLSSYSEGVPYALLEAMGCGIPSVCTAVGGVPEIIEDGVGFLVPPNQPDQLAEKLCTLVADKQLRTQMGNSARKRAVALYSLPDMASNFYKLYGEMAEQKSGEISRPRIFAKIN